MVLLSAFLSKVFRSFYVICIVFLKQKKLKHIYRCCLEVCQYCRTAPTTKTKRKNHIKKSKGFTMRTQRDADEKCLKSQLILPHKLFCVLRQIYHFVKIL